MLSKAWFIREPCYASANTSVPTPNVPVRRQTDWLVASVFDSMGNYLYCHVCILTAFGNSKQQLVRLRNVKQDSSQHPLVEMMKEEVEKQRLGDFVVMPLGEDMAFAKWWKGIHGTTIMNVRYTHGVHGHAGKVSNSAKRSVLDDFLTFVDENSQPNGQSSDSSGPTFSKSLQHCSFPRLELTITRNVFVDLSLESLIVPRWNVDEVLAAMVLAISG